MTDKRLRKLRRSQLLELLLAQKKLNEKLLAELSEGSVAADELGHEARNIQARNIQAQDNQTQDIQSQDFPRSEQIRREMKRTRYRRSLWHALRCTIEVILVAAAVAVLISALMCPVLRIYGHSMNDSLEEGDIVLALKGSDFKQGDVIAFYYNNNLLVKRVIANAGEWVNIDQDGNVFINNRQIEEPYLKEKAYGDANITFPYQVPDERIFVMGDNRTVSVDSRNTAVGCISQEQIVGKVVFRIWPLGRFGSLG